MWFAISTKDNTIINATEAKEESIFRIDIGESTMTASAHQKPLILKDEENLDAFWGFFRLLRHACWKVKAICCLFNTREKPTNCTACF